MSDWLSDPVGALSDTASNWGGGLADIWHGASAPFVDNPFGRMAVNYATGGMSAPLYAAYDYSRGKNVGALQLAGAVSGASNAWDAYNGASTAATYGQDYEGPSSAGLSGGDVAGTAGTAAQYASDFQGDYSGYTNAGESLGGNYGGGNDLQQNITEAGMGGYGGSDLTGMSDYEGLGSHGLSDQFNLRDFVGKWGMPIAKTGMGIYDYLQKKSMASQLRDRYQQMNDQINSYYGPNSPEAAAMKQKLDRLDAAAGRNSQYGVRATDLAARMAQARMNAATQAAPQQNQLLAASGALDAGSLNSLFRGGMDLYKSGALSGLSDLF